MGLEPLVLDGNGDARKVPAHFLEGYGNLDTSLGGGNLGKVAAEYQSFIDRFRSVARALRSASNLDPEQCFVIRTLLMHEFRRVQLRDPSLPRQLLPDDWPGDTARAMCRDIYQLCWGKTEAHLMQMLETADGPLPPTAKSFHARFGGMLFDEPERGASQPVGAT